MSRIDFLVHPLTPVALNVVGLILLFIGNQLITNALTRYDASTTKWWKIGVPLQNVGFILSLLGIFLQYYVGGAGR